MERLVTEHSRPSDRLLRLPEVKARTGLGRSSIYRKVGNGSFPSPRTLGERAVAWRESEVDQWIAACPPKR